MPHCVWSILRTRSLYLRLLLGSMFLVVISCDAPSAQPATANESAHRLENHLLNRRMITLEEDDTVITVNPRATLTPSGNILIADESESQIRLYRPDGRLIRHFGRKGQGPGEFELLNSAVQLKDGRIIGLDTDGSGTVFDSVGNVIKTFRARISPVFISRLLNDSTLLITGRGEGKVNEATIHLWNIARDSLVTSFFLPPVTDKNTMAAGVAGWVNVAVHQDTVAAVFSLSDTVYFFTAHGRAIRKVPIPFEDFRALEQSRPAQMTPAGALDWMEGFSLISGLYWMPNGTMLVQYKNRDGKVSIPNLLAMDAAGQRIYESTNTPLLLMQEPAGNTLYFVRPGSLTRNEWMVAQWAD